MEDKNYRLFELGIMKRKYIILIVLVVSILLTWVVYVRYSQEPYNRLSMIMSRIQLNTKQSSTLMKSHSKFPNSINTIRNLLEAEYDHEDLLNFYSLVERELNLGLRCLRMKNTSQANLTIVSSNGTANNQANTTTLTKSR
jgi:hypothetical protein